MHATVSDIILKCGLKSCRVIVVAASCSVPSLTLESLCTNLPRGVSAISSLQLASSLFILISYPSHAVVVLRWGQGGTGPPNLAQAPPPNFFQGNLGLTCLHQFILYCTI